MCSSSRVQWESSVLLIALLYAYLVSANSDFIQRNEYEDWPRHDTRTGSIGKGMADEVVDRNNSTRKLFSTKAVASIVSAETPSISHQYHRHGTAPEMQRARGISENSSTATTSNSKALSCYSAYSIWREISMSWALTALAGTTWSTTTTTSTLIQTLPTVATIYPSESLSTYKLCDGSPRVNFEPLTLTSSYTSTTEFEMCMTVGAPTYSSSRPCRASLDECEYLYYHSGISWDDYTLMALCGSPPHLGQPCLIMGGPVELAYFPVTTVGSDKCHANGSTIINTGGPTTIEALGTTLTSGSVYLSFKSLYAFQEGFGRKIGPQFTDFILPLPSSAVSTQCGGWLSAQGPGTPLNYADLNFPWPASAYNCMNRCSTDFSWTIINGTNARWTPPPQCSTIWSDLNPILAMPTEVRNLVPAWSTCSMWDEALPNFVFDPPRALVAGTAVATPTPVWEIQSFSTSVSPAARLFTALAETLASRSTTLTSTAVSPIQSSTATTCISSEAAAIPTRGISSTGINIEFSIDGHNFTASAGDNAFSISGQIISVGGPAQVVEGETISLGLSGFVVNATTTIPFSSETARVTADAKGTGLQQQSSPTSSRSTQSRGSMVSFSLTGIFLASFAAMVML